MVALGIIDYNGITCHCFSASMECLARVFSRAGSVHLIAAIRSWLSGFGWGAGGEGETIGRGIFASLSSSEPG